MKLFVIAFLLPLFLFLFNFPLRFCLKGDSCNVLRVIFSGHSCTLDSKTYQKMISTTENYLCENVSFLGSTLKKHYFLAKDNKITTYIHDNDINQKEIDGFDLKDYTVIKATVGENKILLEAVNIAKKDKRYTIVLSNFEAEKINARVYELGNVNLTLCILLCNHFYVIIAEEQKLVQKHFKFNANDELEEVVENVLSNYNEVKGV
uniref:Uncharacterized protein n=1 Tax=Panagrolaimus sp. PS1159 TaxID=55785 RepID=A0AC35GML7_9BILA